MSDRLGFPRGELRARVVRGTLVNASLLTLVDALVVVQGLIVTRLLGPEAIGLYGVVSVTAMTIIALKRVGIDEAFVAQDAADQETEFQHAFTLELLLSAGFALVLLAAAPIVAAVYDDQRLLALDGRHRVPAARLRPAVTRVDLLPAHGLRAPARAAGRASRW